ncbi:P-loop containing nucleoside triphosphate hydrolase protein [Rhodofomes roseus]|uniref:P-loop containing nucleoside triphosphate hydrolase protein n=1 Tax=Rhodofomes roseus TaxID=34475 RepID=A0ABQ8K7F9_9APHY|nr:P-loop containing nucleoside triphosphate hydrolase protein [Rhodofomes roseus]KAH9833196.1 P-loop containing nucleoside triphosphate hydrolase protein [Rhodofomes roseus]
MAKRQLATLSLPVFVLSALDRAGYQTVEDLSGATPDSLSKDLNISLPSSQAVFQATQMPRSVPLTQSAALLVGGSKAYSTKLAELDALLEGGLKRGFILELSGPPGSIKETVAMNVVSSFVEASHHVLFVDMQNMTSPATLVRSLRTSSSAPQDCQGRVHHLRIHTLPDLMIFLRNLPSYLQDHPETALLVLNSLSYPFQSLAGLSNSTRVALLDRVKQTLTRASASTKLTVVITSQLATKLLKPDGSAADFETGSRAIMAPALGPAYLPSAKTYRVCVVPRSRTAGVFRLLSSPLAVHGSQPPVEEAYQLAR